MLLARNICFMIMLGTKEAISLWSIMYFPTILILSIIGFFFFKQVIKNRMSKTSIPTPIGEVKYTKITSEEVEEELKDMEKKNNAIKEFIKEKNYEKFSWVSREKNIIKVWDNDGNSFIGAISYSSDKNNIYAKVKSFCTTDNVLIMGAEDAEMPIEAQIIYYIRLIQENLKFFEDISNNILKENGYFDLDIREVDKNGSISLNSLYALSAALREYDYHTIVEPPYNIKILLS